MQFVNEDSDARHRSKLKSNSREVNGIEGLNRRTQRRSQVRRFLATNLICRDESVWGENIMSKRLLIALLASASICPMLSAQELPLIHQPTLTPQDSGTTSGLIAVSPVNPQVVWASGRNGTFTVTTDGGETWNASVVPRSEEHTSELQSPCNLVCRLLLEKKKPQTLPCPTATTATPPTWTNPNDGRKFFF